MTSRSILNLIAVPAVSLTVSVSIIQAHAQSPAEQQSIDALRKKFHIEIQTRGESFPTETDYGAIDGSNPDPSALSQCLPIVLSEFSLYPPELIEKIGLKRLTLCSHLSFAGQIRGAVPDFIRDALFLSSVPHLTSTSGQRWLKKRETLTLIEEIDNVRHVRN